MAKQMLEAELESRVGDQVLSPEELLKISIFDGVKAANLERYPGTVILRSYKKGQVICRQGEAGWTAFYILKSDDLLAIREGQSDSTLANQIPSLKQRVEKIRAAFTPSNLDNDGNTTEPIPFDLDGNPRVLNDPASDDCPQLIRGKEECSSPAVDMGAYEFVPQQ